MKFQIALIVSGGQTGADRAALDWAIENGVPHGGWCPRGRKAEDGPLAQKYAVQETGSAGYAARTRQNVIDSDGTLIVNVGALDGGTLKTVRIAEDLQKPHIVLQVDGGVGEEDIGEFVKWIRRESIHRLNVAGPRESKRPGIYRVVRDLLDRARLSNLYPVTEERLDIPRLDCPPEIGTFTHPPIYDSGTPKSSGNPE